MYDMVSSFFEEVAPGKALKDVLTPQQYSQLKRREEKLRITLAKWGRLDVAEKLIKAGYCLVPASTHYHGAVLGGLFNHSVAVAHTLSTLTKGLSLAWDDENSPIRIGLFHDLCKLDNYRAIGKSGVDHFIFEHCDKYRFPFGGHASKSLAMCQIFGITLTEQEVMCIRFHMGAYEQEDWEGFDTAIKQDVNVLFTHTADMIASRLVDTQCSKEDERNYEKSF